MPTQSKEGKTMKKPYIKASAEILYLGKADILTFSGFAGKDDVFPLSDGEEEA